ncbi:MAG: RagB/SusD family nutrient uptake outer membrane protein, partial [Chitinophagaceae bacterium]|nr:RagB/SusD family nutrient uptake outer membrane protein [Chitinophagaceae bacterium]
MKPIHIIAASLLLTGSVGCKKYLYEDPVGRITPEQIDLEPKYGTLSSSVTSSYQLLSTRLNVIGTWAWNRGLVVRNDFILQDIASGDMQRKYNLDGDQAWMDDVANFTFTPEGPAFIGQWLYNYEGLARVNQSIAYLKDPVIPGKVGLEEDLRKRWLAEVLFLRAFYYFDLVNNYGDVPLLLKPLENFEQAYELAKRAPKAEVWNQISADLAEAKGLLPATKFTDNNEKWRVSKGAVIAMQAKVALYNEKWNDVITLVTELEGLGFYNLNGNYFDSFDQTKEYTDNEVIFAYDHKAGTLPRNGNGFTALIGWGFIAPTTNFLNEFEANDPRKLYTVNVAQQAPYKLLGTLDNSNKGNEDAPNNKIYIRFGDVLLWKAEAYNETSKPLEAIKIINRVRDRARTTPTADGSVVPAGTLPARSEAVTDKNQINTWLRHERRVELGFESQRFNDLKRWKIAKEVLTA